MSSFLVGWSPAERDVEIEVVASLLGRSPGALALMADEHFHLRCKASCVTIVASPFAASMGPHMAHDVGHPMVGPGPFGI